MKQKFCILSALLCIAFLFASCLNPTQSESGKKSNTGNGGTGGGTIGGGTKDEIVEDTPFGVNDIVIEEEAAAIGGDGYLTISTAALNSGVPTVGTLKLPASEGPWEAELTDDEDMYDNDFFDIEYGANPVGNIVNLNALFDENVLQEPLVEIIRVVVKDDKTLVAGVYNLLIIVSSTGKGHSLEKTYSFKVTNAPAPFSKAPTVYPYITGAGKNKLAVEWKNPAGAETFNIYYGTTDSFEDATLGKSNISAATPSSEITDLPDGTTYYVWVGANNDDGETLSAPVSRTTSFTIPEFFYKDFDKDGNERTDFDRWDSMFGVGYDCYVITPPVPDNPEMPGENEYKPARLEYGTRTGGALPPMRGNIVYFDIFPDGKDAMDNFIRPNGTRTGKHGESLLKDGKETPAGVFIIEYDVGVLPNLKRFQGVYYYGAGAIQTVATGFNPPHVTTTVGLELCYFGNSYWGANPETDTLPEAIDRFTLANMTRHIAFVAIPWYRVYSTTVDEEE
jgi:hypothetical protein